MNYEFDLTQKVLFELSKYGIDIENYKISNNNIQIHCPFASVSGHSDYYDRKPSFGFKVTKGGFKYNCFTCNRKGNSFIQLVDELKKYNLIKSDINPYNTQNEILSYLFKKYKSDSKIKDNKNDEKIEPLIGVPDYSDIDFIEYNLKRGVDIKILKLLNVRYNKKDKSIIFPVYNFNGKYLGYIKHNRFSEPKYKNYINHKNFLYLENKIIKIPTKGIIVEGVYDAIVTYSHLLKLNLTYDYSVVAILGSSINDYQYNLFIEYFSSLILYGDNDEAGIKMEKLLYNKFKYKIPNIWRMRYNGNDPADVKLEDFAVNIKKIRPYGLIF